MQIAFHIILLVVAILLQFTIIPLFSIKGITPNLILVVVISISLRRGQIRGVVTGFFAGLVFDIFGTGFVGVSSLSFSICAFLVGLLASEPLERRFGIILGLLFFVLMIQNILYFSVLSIGTPMGFWAILVQNALPHTIYTLVFIMIIHLLMPRAFWGVSTRY